MSRTGYPQLRVHGGYWGAIVRRGWFQYPERCAGSLPMVSARIIGGTPLRPKIRNGEQLSALGFDEDVAYFRLKAQVR